MPSVTMHLRARSLRLGCRVGGGQARILDTLMDAYLHLVGAPCCTSKTQALMLSLVNRQ